MKQMVILFITLIVLFLCCWAETKHRASDKAKTKSSYSGGDTIKYGLETTKSRTGVDRDSAVVLALAAVKKDGVDTTNYSMIIKESDNEWLIYFEGKQPHPPGDEISVYVSKKEGSVKILRGE